ncbi:M20/M25/M40 family metallo-hydrolase [Massilia sp. SM-13]|uniref:M20/M25/M40 family metallo-hydrolase n=1 Tax=Pseudoduganella rhizocola TaxID=3382643 RepID=UPI0038B5577E
MAKKARVVRGLAVVAVLGAWFYGAGYLEAKRIAEPMPSAKLEAEAMPAAARTALLDDVRTLSSPEFEGRKTGSPGNKKAQALIEQRFAALGLQPFGGSFRQPFSFTHHSVKGLLTPGKHYETAYPDATNIVGWQRGIEKPDRYLVISAHYDHLGVRDGKIYHGADDNASGVAVLLAMAAWFKAHPPKHSVIFAAFDAEEQGLQGAKAFVARLPVPKEQVALNLNMDMISHNDQNQIFVAGTYHYPWLKPLVERAAAKSTVRVTAGHDMPQALAGKVEDWTGSSDHGAFHKAGIPFLYFGVEDHADYHASTDTFDRINADFFARVAQMLTGLSVLLDGQLAVIPPAR